MGGRINTGKIVAPVTQQITLQHIAQFELFILDLDQGWYVCHLLRLLSLVFRSFEEDEMEGKRNQEPSFINNLLILYRLI